MNNAFKTYNQVRHEIGEQYLERMRPVMEELVAQGHSTYSMAIELMKDGHKTVRGKPFTAMNVWLLLKKLGLKTMWSAPDIGATKTSKQQREV